MCICTGLVQLLDSHSESSDGFDEVVVICAAVWTLELLGKLGEAECDAGRFQQRMPAFVTLRACLAAGKRCKEVIVVHRANLMCISTPACRTKVAGDLIDAHQAFETDGGEKEGVICLAFDLVRADICFQRREIEGAIDQRKLVVHIELTPTQHTENLVSSMKG